MNKSSFARIFLLEVLAGSIWALLFLACYPKIGGMIVGFGSPFFFCILPFFTILVGASLAKQNGSVLFCFLGTVVGGIFPFIFHNWAPHSYDVSVFVPAGLSFSAALLGTVGYNHHQMFMSKK